MKTKKEIKIDILNKFRHDTLCSDGTLPPFWLDVVYPNELRTEERPLLGKAVHELVRKGLVESVSQPLYATIRLTKRGEALIYG